MKEPGDTLMRAVLIVRDLCGSDLRPDEQFNVLDLANRALMAVHWQPPPAPTDPVPLPLRSKNVKQ